MLRGHEAVAIVQTAFYILLIPFTIYISVKNWPIKPKIFRITWLTLAVLSLMRFAGGILVIVRKLDPDNFGLTIATVVLLNVGLIPLIMSTFGMIGIVLTASNKKHFWVHRMMILTRIIFITGLSHLMIGAGLSLSGHLIGDRFVQASYIALAVALALVVGILIDLYFERKSFTSTLLYLNAAIIAIPFLILRIIYAILSAFLDPTTWSPLEGSPVAFALMALLPEYIVICIYAYMGLNRAQKHTKYSGEETGDNDDQSPLDTLAKRVGT